MEGYNSSPNFLLNPDDHSGRRLALRLGHTTKERSVQW